MEKHILKELDNYQKRAEKTFLDFGHTVNMMHVLLGISSCLIKLGVASDKRSVDMITDNVANMLWYLSNYASMNNLKFKDLFEEYSLEDIISFSEEFNMEDMIDNYLAETTKAEEVSTVHIVFYIFSLFAYCYPNGTDDEYMMKTFKRGNELMNDKIHKTSPFISKESKKYGEE